MIPIYITLTGTAPGSPDTLVFPEWGERTLVYPLTDYDLGTEYSKEEIRDSESFRTYLNAGYIIVSYNDITITNYDQLILAFNGFDPGENLALIIALGGI